MSAESQTVVRGAMSGWDRQRIPIPWLCVLLAVGLLPLLFILLRLTALHTSGLSAMTATGDWLNQYLTLQWVGFEDRDVVLYILLLPIAALLIALTRLTLGIRVLGFRSILIAIGMQENGVVPCLLLILLIAGAVVLVRPSMRRSGMPLYARVAVVLCIVAFIMLGALLTGAWLDSVTLWSMAFFPLVILAMLAESIADTVARDGLAMAAWRTCTTIVLAGAIAGLNQLTPLRELLLSCPELLLTPLVLIVFVSEFLDMRLLEGFRPGLNPGRAQSAKPQIAVVRNRFPEASPRRLTEEVPRRYRQASLQVLIDQLRDRHYEVHVLECDSSLPAELRSLAHAAFRPHAAGLCVLNCAGGVQGTGRLSQVPVICEMLGIPHTGPGAEATVLRDNRQRQLDELRTAGLQVPTAVSYQEARRILHEGGGDVCVRLLRHVDRGATRVGHVRRLKSVCERMQQRSEEFTIERVPAGRPVTAIVLNPEAADSAHVLPLLERKSGRHPFPREADLPGECRTAAARAAICAAQALGCCDMARVDLYCSESGELTVSRVLAVDPLAPRSASGVAAALGGLSLADIAERTMQSALRRASITLPVYSAEATAGNHHSTINENRRSESCLTSASSAMA